MAREQFTNQAHTGLTEHVDSSETSITVGDASTFPSSGDFRVVVEDEIMVCTSRTGNTLTVTRGQDGTTAVAHESGTRIAHAVTPVGLQNYFRDEVSLFQETLHEAYLRDYNGDTIEIADLSWLNQDTATATQNDDGSITIYAPGNVNKDEVRYLVKAAPAGNFKFTVAVIPQLHLKNGFDNTSYCGICLRDSTSGRIWTLRQDTNSDTGTGVVDRHAFSDWSALTTFVLNFNEFDEAVGRNIQWFQFEYNRDTNLVTPRSSANGFFWRQFANQSSSAYDFDQIGILVNAGNHITAGNQFDTFGTFVCWSEEDA